MLHRELLVAGHFVGGPCDHAIGKAVVRDAWTGSTYATVAEGEWPELDAALDAAQSAILPEPDERARWLAAVSQRIRESRQELAEHLVAEIGKPIDLALAEVDRTAITFDLSASEAAAATSIAHPLDYDARGGQYRAEVRLRPHGTVLAFVPYNWPYNLAAHKIGPALAAGNRIVVKPSPLAAFSTMSLVRLIHECGIESLGTRYDPRVLSVWNGSNADAQRAVQDPRVDFLSFTGSERIGWMLRSLRPQLPAILELGGNATALVLDDAHIDEAVARCTFSALAYAGQICISLQRILVHESIFVKFLAAFESTYLAIRCRDPRLHGTWVGPMIDGAAADRIRKLAQDSCGAVYGGTGEGSRLDPILVVDPGPDSDLWQSEAFGPIVAVAPFSTLDTAVETVNRSRYGIHASVFSSNPMAAVDVAERLNVTGVVINDGPHVRFDALPYGGVKASGVGLEGVPFAVSQYRRPTSLVERIR